jgi:hypothetical protein
MGTRIMELRFWHGKKKILSACFMPNTILSTLLLLLFWLYWKFNQGLALARQGPYHLSHSTSLFVALVIFEIGFRFMTRLFWTMVFLCVLPA